MEGAAVAGDDERRRQGAVAEGGIFVGKEVVMRWEHDGRSWLGKGPGGDGIRRCSRLIAVATRVVVANDAVTQGAGRFVG